MEIAAATNKPIFNVRYFVALCSNFAQTITSNNEQFGIEYCSNNEYSLAALVAMDPFYPRCRTETKPDVWHIEPNTIPISRKMQLFRLRAPLSKLQKEEGETDLV